MIGKETNTLLSQVFNYAAMQEHEVKVVTNYTSEKQELITIAIDTVNMWVRQKLRNAKITWIYSPPFL